MVENDSFVPFFCPCHQDKGTKLWARLGYQGIRSNKIASKIASKIAKIPLKIGESFNNFLQEIYHKKRESKALNKDYVENKKKIGKNLYQVKSKGHTSKKEIFKEWNEKFCKQLKKTITRSKEPKPTPKFLNNTSRHHKNRRYSYFPSKNLNPRPKPFHHSSPPNTPKSRHSSPRSPLYSPTLPSSTPKPPPPILRTRFKYPHRSRPKPAISPRRSPTPQNHRRILKRPKY